MNQRAIRVPEDASMNSEPAPVQSTAQGGVRASNGQLVDLTVAKQVDRLHELEQKLSEERRIARERQADLSREIEALKQELRTFAQDKDMRVLDGLNSRLEFTPSTTRKVEPFRFLKFLSRVGSKQLFWEYVSVPVGKAVKDFGEKILENEGCLTVNSDPYGNQKSYTKRVDG